MTRPGALERANAAAPTPAIRRRIHGELPPEAFQPRPARVLPALALVGAIATVSIILAARPLPAFAALLLSVFCGGLYASLFFLGHEAGHGAVVKSRGAQDAVMWPAFVIFLLSPTLWRVWHNTVHHVHTNQPDYDPDNFGTLATYDAFPSVRVVATLTPGSGRWGGLLYGSIWFTAHAQVVLWVQSRRCRGFESLARARASAESLGMAAFWLSLALWLGPWSSLVVVVIPMLIANAIIMSYIATNHLLRPLGDHADPLDHSMSVTTHRWLDLIHFNFSHHVEHHLFPSMSSRYAPLVRAKLRRYAAERYVAPSHGRALRLVFQTPRVHDPHGALIDPRSGRRASFEEIDTELRPAQPTQTRSEVNV